MKSFILADWQARAAADGRLMRISVPLKPQPPDDTDEFRTTGMDSEGWYAAKCIGRGEHWSSFEPASRHHYFCPYPPGTVLVGKESVWLLPPIASRMLRDGADTWPDVMYDADMSDHDREQFREWKWRRRSSTAMPRKFARHRWTVEAVSVRRVQELTVEEIDAHGYPYAPKERTKWAMGPNGAPWFWEVWDARYGKDYPWESNPWAWGLKLEPEKA